MGKKKEAKPVCQTESEGGEARRCLALTFGP